MQHGSERSAASSSRTGASPWPESSFPASASQGFSSATTSPASLSAMGQTFSRSHAATSSPDGPLPAQRGLTAAMTGGLRLKRAFAGRRKKSEDAGKATAIMDRSMPDRDETQTTPRHQHHLRQHFQASPSTSSSTAQVIHAQASPSTPAKRFSQLASQVFATSSSKKLVKGQSSLHQRELPTPPPPPKPAHGVVLVAGAQPRTPPKTTETDYPSSIPISPGILSAVSYMYMDEQVARANLDQEEAHAEEVNRGKAKEKENLAEKKEDAHAHAHKDMGATRSRSQEKEREAEQTQGQGRARTQRVGHGPDADADKAELPHKAEKDAWRKSDSTMSHHTIRPFGHPRSRPVSMAESLQSNYTVVPGPGGISRRQSALISDADFGMAEEDSGSESDVEDGASNVSASTGTSATTSSVPTTSTSVSQPHHEHSPTPSLQVRDHRSMSVNIPTHTALAKHVLPPTPASASATSLIHSVSSSSSPPSSHWYTQRVPPPPYIAPSSSTSASPSSSPPRRPPQITNTAASPNNNPYTTFPPPPETRPASRMDRDRKLPALPQSPRQPTLSLTSGLGLAAKRAVEKLGMLGKWGLSTNTNTPTTANLNASRPQAGAAGGGSGYSSGTSGTSAPSAFMGSKGFAHGYSSSTSSVSELTRTSSGQSSLNPHTHISSQGKPKKHAVQVRRRSKHVPNTPSISSVSTSASTSEAEEAEARRGPYLGKRLRGPLKNGGGGVVFGRDLRSVVRDTSVGVGKPQGWGWRNWDGEDGAGPHAEDYDQQGGGEAGVNEGEGETRRSRTASVRRGQLKALEERNLPALVVRCAQHLLSWGVQEEGLFRVPGRAFHVSKLRAEFDSGADFDMAECSPGDLDPHAVASVFKAFLRELPEPILTNALMPYFEAAMVQESTDNANKDAMTRARSNSRGVGLPANPRMQLTSPVPTLNKAPSLSTLAMPKLSGLPPPSKALCSAFQLLLARLPDENRDLVRTVTELIRATAHDSVATKMPLSNLLLVFCPSLNMSPSLLRVLCEAEGIWEKIQDEDEGEEDVVLDISSSAAAEAASMEEVADDEGERKSLLSVSVGRRSEDVPSSLDYHASNEDVVPGDDRSSMSAPLSRLGGHAHARKGSVASSSLGDDGSSYLSTSEDHDNPASHSTDVHSQSVSPPPLTSSAESLDTPTTSSLHSSLSHLPTEGGTKYSQPGMSPIIAEALAMGLSSNLRRPIITSPLPITGSVQFPLSPSDNLPPLPNVERRRSIPILSLSSISSNSAVGQDSHSAPVSLASRARRMKKPSLQLLFSKKSSSSLTSPPVSSSPGASLKPKNSNLYLQNRRSTSDSSVSTPLSAVTAPESSTLTLPPQLDTPIESSSLRFALGLGIDVVETPSTATSTEKDKAPSSKAASTVLRPLPVPPTSVAQQVSASVASLVRPGSTPIADRYHHSTSPSPSLLASKSQLSAVNANDSVAPVSHLRPIPTRARGFSTSSNASSNHLGMLDEESDDWTRSVLLAADAEGGWAIERPARV